MALVVFLVVGYPLEAITFWHSATAATNTLTFDGYASFLVLETCPLKTVTLPPPQDVSMHHRGCNYSTQALVHMSHYVNYYYSSTAQIRYASMSHIRSLYIIH
jgi:hypothetical protein